MPTLGLDYRAHSGLWVVHGFGNAAPAPGVPDPPTNLTGVSTVVGGANLSWRAPLNTGGASIDTYRVNITRISNMTTTTVGTSSLSVSLSGLAAGEAYSFTIQAHNSYGYSSATGSLQMTIAASSGGTGINYLASPSTFGYPDETNTGYLNYFAPELGRKLVQSDLTVINGNFTTTSENQVIYKKWIKGKVIVQHGGVSFLGTKVEFLPSPFTGSSPGNRVVTDHHNGVGTWPDKAWSMSYCEISSNEWTDTLMNTAWANVDHCDIHDGADAWDPFGYKPSEWYFNYMHNLVQNPVSSPHCDVFQPVGGDGPLLVHHNTMKSYNQDTGFFGNTSIMQIGQLTGDITGLLDFYDNLNDGGNYMANANWASDGTNDLLGSISIRDNRLGPASHTRFGLHIHIPDPLHTDKFTISNNVWDADNTLAWG